MIYKQLLNSIHLKKARIKNSSLKSKNTYLFLAVFILFFSCEKHIEEDAYLLTDNACDNSASYATVIKPIIENNCLECHAGNESPNLSSYARLSNNAALVRAQVVSRLMPRDGSLTDEEIAFIRCWIDDGAFNN